MIVHHDDLIDQALPLRGEHADRRRAAPDPHSFFTHTVHDRRCTGLDDNRRSFVNGGLNRLAIAQVQQSVWQVTRPSFLPPPVK